MSNQPEPEPEPKSKLSLLAQTIQAIGGSAFILGMGMGVQQSQARCEFDEAMWEAAASLSTSEYAQVRKLKAAWVSGARWG